MEYISVIVCIANVIMSSIDQRSMSFSRHLLYLAIPELAILVNHYMTLKPYAFMLF